jgi:hypothetical protein
MKRTARFLGLGAIVLGLLLLALEHRTAIPVQADSGSFNWDAYMSDPTHAAPTSCTSNDNDGLIEVGECPDVSFTMWVQPEGGLGGSQSFADLASTLWTTGPLGASDLTGDTIVDPTDGLIVNRPSTIAAKVGELTFSITSGLSLGALLNNNVDDIGGSHVDDTVNGQPVRCGADLTGDTVMDTVALQDTLELWNAPIDDSSGTVSHLDTDASGKPDTRDPDPSYPLGCSGTNCAPRGATKWPIPLTTFETSIGFPAGSAMMRAFGIARLPIMVGYTTDLDINVLVYGLHNLGSAPANVYLTLTLPGYAFLPGSAPLDPTYSAFAQTALTCVPYWFSNVIYGATGDPDFNEDATLDMIVTPEMNQLMVGSSGQSYAYLLQTSTHEDFDGDTIPSIADRCDTDKNSGGPVGDTDGDTITGACETTGAGNGEGNNPGPFVKEPPWAAGQDVDGDGYINYADNCPTVADADLDDNGRENGTGPVTPGTGDCDDSVDNDGDTKIDAADPQCWPQVDYQLDTDGDTVGDVCDPAITVPGDGSGYATPAPGMLVDNVNYCSDWFTIGQAEPQGEAGDIFTKVCLGPTVAAASQPYANPAPAVARLSSYRDSNNDGTPDFWDGLTSASPPAAGRAVYDYLDANDKDGDNHSDGCESFRGTDALDALSTPGAPSVAGDCDNDGATDTAELAAGTNPLDGIDSDGDGFCSDAEEVANGTNPNNWYDFFDVPVPARKDSVGANGVRNGAIDIGDVLAILFYSGANNNGPANGNGVDYDSDKNGDGIEDGVDYDRTPGPGAPNGAIDISDVLAALGQSGKACPAKGVK